MVISSSLHNRCGTNLIFNRCTHNHNWSSLVDFVGRQAISIRWGNGTRLKSISAGTGRRCSWSFSTPKASLMFEDYNDQLDQTTSPILTVASQPRPLANFVPDVWGDHFLNYTPEDDDLTPVGKEEMIEEVKKQIRKELVEAAATKYTNRLMNLIDNIQRLGLAYHFEKEIEHALQHVYDTTCNDDSSHHHLVHDHDDLYSVSLRYRLLRQQGFDSSSDVFNKFTYDNGKFKESLTGDMKGLLSLYEAAHFAKPQGDEILDAALAFTMSHLSYVANSSDHNYSDLVPQICYALKYPLLKSVPRLEARRYIPVYEDHLSSHNDQDPLLQLAKLDFNHLQSMHKQEISDLVRWWKEMDIERKVTYARSRVVELYFWVNTMYFEPQYRLGRMLLTKMIAVASVIDDTYDSYATFEELQLLTEAIERWSRDCVDQLPKNLKACYELLLDTYDEIEKETARIDRSYQTLYAKRAMKRLVRAYFKQAEWLKDGYMPSMEEYMSCAPASASYFTVPISSLVGMTDPAATKEAFDWFESEPNILVAGGKIARIEDDIGSHTFEREREHIASAVEIYMKQYNTSEKLAKEELRVEVDKAWKEINGELLLKHVPTPLLAPTLNLTRGTAFTYLNGDDDYTNSGPRVKEAITLLFIDPIPM